VVTNILAKIVAVILGLIIAGVALQAPISVLAETYFSSSASFVKAWKEILLLPAVFALLYIIHDKKQWRWFVRDRFVQIGSVFVLLHVLTAVLLPTTNTLQVFSGLLIDTRFVVYFLCVYTLLHFYRNFISYIIIPALIASTFVIFFGVLQVLILPKDVLSVLGYGAGTIQPYLTVDNNENYIRINSTLRGPNPLGLYVAVTMASLVGYMALRRQLAKWAPHLVLVLAASVLVIAHTYSRSAYLAAIITAMLLLFVLLRGQRQLQKKVAAGLLVVSCVSMIVLAATWQTPFVQQVVFHTDIYEQNDINSDQQHHASVMAAIAAINEHPFGAGIGSTGSASLFSDKPFIIENYYLFVAHEVGWLGLLLFIVFWFYVLCRLYKKATPLAWSMAASGMGIVVAAMVLPVWADDTLAITRRGLAAVAMMTPGRGRAL
jgi:O-Antigen ligase